MPLNPAAETAHILFPMRHGVVLLVLLVALLVPAAAVAVKEVPGDGTLSVRKADGFVTLDLDRGAVLGQMGSGVLLVRNPKKDDCDTLLVWEFGERTDALERETKRGDLVCRYEGRKIRFRIVGGEPNVAARGSNIALAAVGRGSAQLRGTDGSYSVNGGEYIPLPDELRKVSIGATLPSVARPGKSS